MSIKRIKKFDKERSSKQMIYCLIVFYKIMLANQREKMIK
jgi:hypothetical protein